MIRISSILGCSLLVSGASLHAQDAQSPEREPETVGRFLLSMPARTLEPMIEHFPNSLGEHPGRYDR